ncbi:ribonuclease inhibitor [Chitinophaga qingshengii]|uniref:Ribonuclease inhibitor n=1 Tax=Chitinophaga qingshengii TaxID=1569794 RepID=A0ABR7TG32_9BACT|nr:ribonuclease inhibitor [Chitinophaga qingshengii]MBC9928875.1 ribonuclease inhibitor [Chitinophaga qingshengii]
MQPNSVVCPVDHVKETFPFQRSELDPVLQYLQDNQPLPVTNLVFPVGTVTTDGRLDMCKQQLGIEGVQLVTAALQQNTQIKHILMGTNAFGNPGAQAIADLVAVNNTIETVYLGCNYIEQAGAQAICEALSDNQSVKSMWFKRNPIGGDSMHHIVQLLQQNPHLRTLDLVNTCAGEGFLTLLEYLKNNTTIERLYLSGNYLTADMMLPVSDMLAANKHLKALFLSVNNIGDKGVANLMPGLKQNTTLEQLSLSSCGIEAEGMQLLHSLLSTRPYLKWVDLGYAPSTKALGAKGNIPQHLSAMKDFPSVPENFAHPDSKAIKSVYR